MKDFFKQFVCFLICTLCFSVNVEAQTKAKKPRLVVIPSDKLMKTLHCLEVTDDMGVEGRIPNYDKALLDTDLGSAIAKIGEIFKSTYGFPLTSLEQELKTIKGKGVSVIPVDIRIELNYKIEQQGPRKYLYFELLGIDQYSSKQIAAASGESAPAIGGTVTNLLQEAVMSKTDKFVNDIGVYFDEMASNGRESRLTIKSDVAQLNRVVIKMTEEWLTENCVNSSFSTDNVEASEINISQAMMPLFDANGKPLAASDFYNGLAKYLTSKVKSKNYEAILDRSATNSGSRGGTLGDAVIVISEANVDEF